MVARERKRKRAKEREKNEGRLEALPSYFPALSLALFFAHAPLSERLEQASDGNFEQSRRGQME